MLILDKKLVSRRGCCWNNTLLFLCCVISLLLFPDEKMARAGELVHGTYLSSSGKTIELSITAGTPPPSHIIVAQTIPPGVNVASSQPEAQKINIQEGKIKWLLKKVQPGSQTLKIILMRPVQPTMIGATIRYRHPVTGGYVETFVTP